MNKKRPTQADVAKLAGVSQAMVSRVLTNSMTFPVPVETKQRILSVIDQIGYVPDTNARSLRTRKSYTIASIIPDITNPFYPAFQRGIQDVVNREGYDLIMYNTDGAVETERKYLRSVQEGRADGVIATFFHLTTDDFRELLARNIAVVHMDVMYREIGDMVLDRLYVDNAQAARTAVSYLISKGHTRVSMIAGQEDTPPRAARIQGYRQALAEHHIPLDEILIRDGDFTEKGGYQGMRALLQLDLPPTAVFAANDLMAIGALHALRDAGLHVPQDVAVVGFDDIPAATLVSPQLTTIAQFQEQLGRRAAEMLLERLNGTAPEGGRCEALPYELIIRESA